MFSSTNNSQTLKENSAPVPEEGKGAKDHSVSIPDGWEGNKNIPNGWKVDTPTILTVSAPIMSKETPGNSITVDKDQIKQ